MTDSSSKSYTSQTFDLCVPSKALFVPILVATCALPVIQLLNPLYWGMIVDSLARNDEADALKYALLSMLALAFGIFVEWAIETERFKKIGHDIGLSVSLRLLEKLSSLSLGQVSVGIGERRAVIYAGIYATITSVGRVFQTIPIGVIVTVALWYMFYRNADAGWIAAVFVTLYVSASIWINLKVYPKAEAYRRHEAKVEERFFEKAANMPLVIRTDQAARALSDYAREHDAYTAEGRSVWLPFYSMVALIRDPMALLCLSGLTFMSIRQYFRGDTSLGDFIAIIGLADAMFLKLTCIGRMQQDFMQDKAKIKALLEILKTPRETPVPLHPIRLTSLGQTIRFDDVKFRGLDGVSFEIPPGSFTAILGESGSGKTTALSLMQGGYALERGRVLVGKEDIESLDLAIWRRSIGYVEQNPLFWNMSLEDNILYGLNGHAKDITERDLHAVMVKAQLGKFYGRLGEAIGEGGSRLSGGERQRVAIARALIGAPHLLVFDEAMSGLDVENETRLIAMILELVKETDRNGVRRFTIVAATHNLEMAEKADRIIMLEKGKVVGVGTRDYLLDTCDAYSRFVTIAKMNHVIAHN